MPHPNKRIEQRNLILSVCRAVCSSSCGHLRALWDQEHEACWENQNKHLKALTACNPGIGEIFDDFVNDLPSGWWVFIVNFMDLADKGGEEGVKQG